MIVLYSGGIGSWAAARRLKEQGHRPTLLFTDTGIEDEDLYRFLHDSVESLGLPFIRIADGRTPWELFNDEGFIGNTRVDLCSRVLKRDLSRRWIDHRHPHGTTVAVGMDWTEVNRIERAEPRWRPHTLIAPLAEPPYLSKGQMLEQAERDGVKPPRLYGLGFPHNNCGGFCVKQGQAAFLHLARTFPERYAEHEDAERAFREDTGKDVAILRDRRGGTTKPLTLEALRERDDGCTLDLSGFGGCGCGV